MKLSTKFFMKRSLLPYDWIVVVFTWFHIKLQAKQKRTPKDFQSIALKDTTTTPEQNKKR